MSDERPAVIVELLSLLEDPQVSEFLAVYLSIRDPETKAHLQRAVAAFVMASRPGAKQLKDTLRRRKLHAGPTAGKRGKYVT